MLNRLNEKKAELEKAIAYHKNEIDAICLKLAVVEELIAEECALEATVETDCEAQEISVCSSIKI